MFALTLWLPQVFNDGDTWWHVAAGRLMIARGEVLATDPFSFTMAGRPWMTHEWLSEVLFGGAFNLGGWGGVQLLTALAAGAAAGLLARCTARWTTGLPQVSLLVVALSLCMPHLLARPHVLAWPLLVAWTAELLVARDEDRAPRWRFLPLMVLWANLHGSSLFGPVLVAPFALEAVLAAPAPRRASVALRWGGFGLAAALAALATPHGIGGIVYELRLTLMSSLGRIGEWQAADFASVQPVEIALLGVVLFMLLRPLRLPVIRALVLLVLAHVALRYNRHEQLLGLVGALLLAKPLGEVTFPATPRLTLRPSVVLASAVGVAVLLGGARLATPVVWRDSLTRPVQALASVPADLRAQPVLNDFQYGGYLIGHGVRPYIDSRSDMYGDGFLQAYARLADGDRAALTKLLAGGRIRWAILVAGSPMERAMRLQPGWRRTHADAWAVVYARDPGAAAGI
ncbi:MAG: hypothetical protein ACJ798_17200 [Phenylobacterium sp.]